MIIAILPIAVLAMLLLFVSQVRRLLSHAILNRTIRKAFELDPASAPLLIAKLEPRPRWPDGLAGWIMFVAGVVLAVAALFGPLAERFETLRLSCVAIVIGIGILLYAWWVERQTPSA